MARGGHELTLSHRGVTDRLAADVERAEAEFSLVVEGPWIVLCYRIGDSSPWSSASPFNWHMTPEGGRVVPAEVELSPETYARLWSTLWISLVDAESGVIRVRRAVALCPEFTRALHNAIRAQALEPFSGAAGDHALAWLSHSEGGPFDRAVARARCAAASCPDFARPVRQAPADGKPREPRTRIGSDRPQSVGTASTAVGVREPAVAADVS